MAGGEGEDRCGRPAQERRFLGWRRRRSGRLSARSPRARRRLPAMRPTALRMGVGHSAGREQGPRRRNRPSVDERLHEARAAVESAHQAEREAVEKAKRAHELAERLRQVEKQHRKRLAMAASERDEAIGARVAEARRRADEAVEGERAAAESDQADKLRSLEDALAADRRDVESQAQAAQDAAREQIAHAEQRMAEARRLSDEAAEAAAAAATAAHLAAEELAAHASATPPKPTVRSLSRAGTRRRDAAAATSALENRDVVAGVAGPLRERTIAELLPVAAALGIEGRSADLRHDQFVTAINRARSRQSRAVGRAATPSIAAEQGTRRPASTDRTQSRPARSGQPRSPGVPQKGPEQESIACLPAHGE